MVLQIWFGKYPEVIVLQIFWWNGLANILDKCNVTDTISWWGHHDRIMQLNWLWSGKYFDDYDLAHILQSYFYKYSLGKGLTNLSWGNGLVNILKMCTNILINIVMHMSIRHVVWQKSQEHGLANNVWKDIFLWYIQRMWSCKYQKVMVLEILGEHDLSNLTNNPRQAMIHDRSKSKW